MSGCFLRCTICKNTFSLNASIFNDILRNAKKCPECIQQRKSSPSNQPIPISAQSQTGNKPALMGATTSGKTNGNELVDAAITSSQSSNNGDYAVKQNEPIAIALPSSHSSNSSESEFEFAITQHQNSSSPIPIPIPIPATNRNIPQNKVAPTHNYVNHLTNSEKHLFATSVSERHLAFSERRFSATNLEINRRSANSGATVQFQLANFESRLTNIESYYTLTPSPTSILSTSSDSIITNPYESNEDRNERIRLESEYRIKQGDEEAMERLVWENVAYAEGLLGGYCYR